MRVYKVFLDWSDRIDIWIQETYNKQPKKKLLEMQQDHFPNQKVHDAITEALMENKERSPRKEKKKPKKKKKQKWQ